LPVDEGSTTLYTFSIRFPGESVDGSPGFANVEGSGMRLSGAFSCLLVLGSLVRAETPSERAQADAAPNNSVGIEDVLHVSA
jgi:hypothetical protein